MSEATNKNSRTACSNGLVYSLANNTKYVLTESTKSRLDCCTAYFQSNKTLNPLFWMRKVLESLKKSCVAKAYKRGYSSGYKKGFKKGDTATLLREEEARITALTNIKDSKGK